MRVVVTFILECAWGDLDLQLVWLLLSPKDMSRRKSGLCWKCEGKVGETHLLVDCRHGAAFPFFICKNRVLRLLRGSPDVIVNARQCKMQPRSNHN